MGQGWNSARTRHWTRVSAKQARRQTQLMQEQLRLQIQAQAAMTRGPAAAPAGWYPNSADAPGVLRWWDGTRWTEHVHQQQLG